MTLLVLKKNVPKEETKEMIRPLLRTWILITWRLSCWNQVLMTCRKLNKLKIEEIEELEEESSTPLKRYSKGNRKSVKEIQISLAISFFDKVSWASSWFANRNCSQSKRKMCHYRLSHEANESTWTHRFQTRFFKVIRTFYKTSFHSRKRTTSIVITMIVRYNGRWCSLA